MMNRKEPVVGDIYAMPLKDGRYSICKIVQIGGPQCSYVDPGVYYSIIGYDWTGDEIPTLDDIKNAHILYLNHHSWHNEPNIVNSKDLPPNTYKYIDNVKPTDEDLSINYNKYGHWDNISLHTYLEWRWNNDKMNLLKEEMKDRERIEEFENKKRMKKRIKTLKQIRRTKPFKGWIGYIDKEIIGESRRIILYTFDELIKLQGKKEESGYIGVIKKSVEMFNKLDEKHHFIYTIEREDIAEVFFEIGDSINIENIEDIFDEYRGDW
jgi:hypothetical protein